MLQRQNFKILALIAGFVLLGLVSMASISLAQKGTWTKKVDMPTARWCFSTCAVYGKIYAFGGFATDRRFDTVEKYDYVSNTWTTQRPLKEPSFGMSTSTVNGKIYIIGGDPTPKVVYEYDPVTDRYFQKKDMPTGRMHLSTSVVRGKIYAIGGSVTYNSGFYKTVEEYDPLTDTWTSKKDMSIARNAFSTSVVNGKIYAIGGFDGSPFGISTVEEYDPMTDTWTKKAPMPTSRAWFSTSVVKGKIYVIGGGCNYTPLSVVEVYDPATDTWDTTNIPPMPTARWGFSTSEVNGDIYAIGGAKILYGPPWDAGLKTVEQFNPLATSVKEVYWLQNNPTKFLLHQNYPNPFNPSTTISYALAKDSQVRLTIYNTLGHVMAVLVDGMQTQGSYSVTWDAGNQPSGLYICRFEADGFTATKKMFLQK